MSELLDEIGKLPLDQRMARLLELRTEIDQAVSDTIDEAVHDEGGREKHGAMARAARKLGVPYTTVTTAMDLRLTDTKKPKSR